MDDVDDVEAGKSAFLKLVAQVDASLSVVIPSAATQDNFLIALSNDNGRAMLMVAEDDLLDLVDDEDIVDEVRAKVVEAANKINA